MSAAQAAQQVNRDAGGRYAEQAHTDPGAAVLGGLDFATADPDGVLNEAQRAHVNMLAGLMAVAGKLRVDRSCDGQRYVAVEADNADYPGVITRVSCLFWVAIEGGIPAEAWATSGWKWSEKIGAYDCQAVSAQLKPAASYDRQEIAATMARLAALQDRLDEQLNKPALRGDPVHSRTVDAHVHGSFGVTQLDMYLGSGRDTFTVEHGRVVKASIQTERYGQLQITDPGQLDVVMSELGRSLSLQIDGVALPDWRQGRPPRRVVEQFLFGDAE